MRGRPSSGPIVDRFCPSPGGLPALPSRRLARATPARHTVGIGKEEAPFRAKAPSAVAPSDVQTGGMVDRTSMKRPLLTIDCLIWGQCWPYHRGFGLKVCRGACRLAAVGSPWIRSTAAWLSNSAFRHCTHRGSRLSHRRRTESLEADVALSRHLNPGCLIQTPGPSPPLQSAVPKGTGGTGDWRKLRTFKLNRLRQLSPVVRQFIACSLRRRDTRLRLAAMA
jgi:hypothetical protein